MLSLQDQCRSELRAKLPLSAAVDGGSSIFSRRRVNFQPSSPVTHMAVADGRLVVVMANKQLLKIDLHHATAPPVEVDLLKETTGSRIQHVFVSPCGRHMLVSTLPREGDLTGATLLFISGVKVRQVSPLKGCLVTAVGWTNQHVQPKQLNTTGPLLLGTSRGLISETNLSADDRVFARLDLYTKRLYELDGGHSVCAIVCHRSSISVSSVSGRGRRCFVLVATPTRLYQFVGDTSDSSSSGEDKPCLTAVFLTTPGLPEKFCEIPGTWPVSRLAVLYSPASDNQRPPVPTHFAWMVEPGILHGELKFDDRCEQEGQALTGVVIGDTNLITHNSTPAPVQTVVAASGGAAVVARSVALSQFHAVSLLAGSVTAYNVLSQRVVYEDSFCDQQSCGAAVCLARDADTGVLWCATERAIFRYIVVDESRHVWQILVEKGMFAEARRSCQDNPAILDKVLAGQADKCFREKKYMESAAIYAESSSRVESVALKFITDEQFEALQLFLRTRAAGVERETRAGEEGRGNVALVLMLLWTLELFLVRLDCTEPQSVDHDQLIDQMISFIISDFPPAVLCTYRDTIYRVLRRHGYAAVVSQLAARLCDAGVLFKQQLARGLVTQAVDTLWRLVGEPGVDASLLPANLSRLMAAEPRLTVDLLIARSCLLPAPALMVPHLIAANQSCEQGVEVVRYLEHCVSEGQCRDAVVHNYLVTLYVENNLGDKLMSYLRAQGSDRWQVSYSPTHVLRQCWHLQPAAAALHVLMVVGRHEEAVQLALQHSLATAKQVANSRLKDEDLSKRLWLLIAKHTIQRDQGVQRAMQFLSECPLLSIEDVLPFFPDFVTIDDFKDTICSSLQAYNEQTERLRAEMNEAAEASDVLRREMAALSRRHTLLQADDSCRVCGGALLAPSTTAGGGGVTAAALLVFPCRHAFHRHCVMSELSSRHEFKQMSGASAGADLADAAATQCLVCGDYLISDVDNILLNKMPDLFSSSV